MGVTVMCIAYFLLARLRSCPSLAGHYTVRYMCAANVAIVLLARYVSMPWTLFSFTGVRNA
jgi:hypothetical protein